MLHRFVAPKGMTPEERLILVRLQINALTVRINKHLGVENIDEPIDVFEIRRILEDLEDSLR